MKFRYLLAAISLATGLLTPQFLMAAPGHDHGEATPTATGTALPRFSAVSDLFELVGVLKGQQITLYLDRSADNSPVTDAQIELEIGGQQYIAAKQGTDEFEVVLNEAVEPGLIPITAMVVAGDETDLLAGELDIHQSGLADEPVHAHSWWEEYTDGIVGAAIALVVLILLVLVGRRFLASRAVRAGGAA